jgi:hypothetical protein
MVIALMGYMACKIFRGGKFSKIAKKHEKKNMKSEQ